MSDCSYRRSNGMTRFFVILTVIIVLVSAGCASTEGQEMPADREDASISSPSSISSPFVKEYVEMGEYGVSLLPVYFHDPDREFDAWNAIHASDEYKALLKEINDAGEKHIVAGHIWYPTAEGSGQSRPATFADFSASKSKSFTEAFERQLLFYLRSIVNEEIMQDPANAETKQQELFSNEATTFPLFNEIKKRFVNSSYGAAIAPGNFPIIVAAHGLGCVEPCLGGDSFGWSVFAEYLASHGYVVVAPSFLSDSSSASVLDSPDSAFFAQEGLAGMDRAYQLLLTEDKVIPDFFKYLFGYEEQADQERFFSTTGLQFADDGGQRVGDMMGQFFTQRVDDVETIIDGLESLNKSRALCLQEYEAREQPKHGAELCGLFSDALDLGSVGVLGQSLGSMTAQFSVKELIGWSPLLDTTMALQATGNPGVYSETLSPTTGSQ